MNKNLANLKNSSNTFEVTDNRVAIVIKSSFVVLASESKWKPEIYNLNKVNWLQ